MDDVCEHDGVPVSRIGSTHSEHLQADGCHFGSDSMQIDSLQAEMAIPSDPLQADMAIPSINCYGASDKFEKPKVRDDGFESLASHHHHHHH